MAAAVVATGRGLLTALLDPSASGAKADSGVVGNSALYWAPEGVPHWACSLWFDLGRDFNNGDEMVAGRKMPRILYW